MTDQKKAEKLFYESLNYIKSRDYVSALQKLLEANRLSLNRKSILINLCKIYFELNDLENLKKYLDNLLVLFKKDDEITLIEIAYNIKAGNLNHAKLKLQTLESKNNSEALILNLEINKKFYDFEHTSKSYKELLETNTSNLEYLKSLIFMQLYANPFNQEEYTKLTEKFKQEVNKTFKITKEKLIKEDCGQLNLGFLVNNYPNDPGLAQIKGILKELKKKSVNLYCFLDNSSKQTESLKYLFNHIFNIEKSSVNEASKLISKQNLDFLFDLSGYSAGNRIEIFMSKPAKKIISWAGYLCDTKINEIDYIILDEYCDDSNHEKIDENKKLFIDKIWCPYPIINEDIPKIRQKEKFKDTFNFGSFANPFKYNDEVIKTWSEIINKSNKTKLFLSYFNLGYSESAEKLYEKFKKYGVDKNKIIIEGLKDKKKVLSDYNEIDLILDTFPYCGMTTSFQAILMDTPILTLKGNQFLSNCGYSINKNLSLDFLIAENIELYIEKAVTMSENSLMIEKLQKKIKENKFNSCIFDEYNFAQKLITKLNIIKNQKNKIC